MTIRTWTIGAAVLAAVASFGSAPQATQAKQKQPPAGVAVQMPGDNGKVGVPYKLGAKGQELHFTLEKAEFASRAITQDGALFAEPGKRLLVISYAIQNPHKTDAHFFEQSFKFTVVSPDDVNYEYDGYIFHPDRRDRLNMQLKPAQKVRAIAVIPIHPSGPVNKLIVQRGQGTPVLRYDLRGKVKPMTGAFAGAEGLEMLETGASVIGTPFEAGPFDVTIEKVEDSSAAVGQYTLESGQKLVVVTATVKNASLAPRELHYSILTPKMVDENGEELEWTFGMLKMGSDDQLNTQVQPGQQVRTRLIFRGPAAAKPVSVEIKEQSSERATKVAIGPS